MPKPTVYLETSVVSYLTSRPSRDLIVQARQQLTAEWWETSRRHFSLYVSPFVLEEIAAGDTEAAEARQAVVDGIPVLRVSTEILRFAEHLLKRLHLPASAQLDALHIATPTWHGLDFLVTWNCKHIANGRIIKALEQICLLKGMRLPVICTPEELLE